MPNASRVRLLPLAREHLCHVHRWASDPELCGLIGETPATPGETEAWFVRASADRDRRWFLVVTRADGRPIGEAGLLRIDTRWRTADMSIVIGERDAWGRGHGTEIAEMLFDLAFRELALHRLAIGVVGFNERALGFWGRVGFRREGRQRDGYLHDGRFHDFVMMSLLEEEWRARRHRAGPDEPSVQHAGTPPVPEAGPGRPA